MDAVTPNPDPRVSQPHGLGLTVSSAILQPRQRTRPRVHVRRTGLRLQRSDLSAARGLELLSPGVSHATPLSRRREPQDCPKHALAGASRAGSSPFVSSWVLNLCYSHLGRTSKLPSRPRPRCQVHKIYLIPCPPCSAAAATMPAPRRRRAGRCPARGAAPPGEWALLPAAMAGCSSSALRLGSPTAWPPRSSGHARRTGI